MPLRLRAIPRIPKALPVWAITVWGIVVGHAGAYLLAHPHSEERSLRLETTGHAYWDLAVLAAAIAFTVAMVASASRGRHRLDESVAPRHRLTWPYLLVKQWAGFSALELIEFLSSGHTVAELLHEPAWGWALAILTVTSLLASLFLRVAETLGAALARTSLPRTRDPERWSLPLRLASPPDALLGIPRGRAPPSTWLN